MLPQRCSKQHVHIRVLISSISLGIDHYGEKYTRSVQQTGMQLYIYCFWNCNMYHQLTYYFLDYSCALSSLRAEQQYEKKKKKKTTNVVGELLLRTLVGYVEHMQHIPHSSTCGLNQRESSILMEEGLTISSSVPQRETAHFQGTADNRLTRPSTPTRYHPSKWYTHSHCSEHPRNWHS